MSCSAISVCKSLTASVDCSQIIFQGTDAKIDIQLYDVDGEFLDLDLIESMLVVLYTDGFILGTFKNPLETDNDYYNIEFLQAIHHDGVDEHIDDKGVIQLNITPQMSTNFITGPIYAEIKIKFKPENTNDDPIYKLITCLKLGTTGFSYSKDELI